MENDTSHVSNLKNELANWARGLLAADDKLCLSFGYTLPALEAAGELNVPQDDPGFVQKFVERAEYLRYMTSEVVADLEELLSVDIGCSGFVFRESQETASEVTAVAREAGQK